MRRLVLGAWEELRAFLEEQPPAGASYYYRGQRDPDWPLASSLERQLLARLGGERGAQVDSGRYQALVREHLDRFKRAASGLRGSSPKDLTEEQWWALGRHYGLTTPLLDWTEKPYIALFFALRGPAPLFGDEAGPLAGRSFAVYRLSRCDRLPADRLRVVHTPIDELGRMQQQRGVFTWIRTDRHFDLQSVLEDAGCGDLLTQACVAAAVVPLALRDLDLHGIDHRLLFPDLYGAAGHANAHLGIDDVVATPSRG